MKRVLVLYPGMVEERRAWLARQRWRLRLAGVRLVLADQVIEPEDAAAFAQVLELPPPEEAARAWEALARFADRHRVDGVIAQSEPSLLLGARLARRFGLRAVSVAGALATTNKLQSRRLLDAADVSQPRFALAGSAADVRAFVARTGCGWPVVLKAVASSRQRLVTRVAGPREVDAAVARLLGGLPDSKDVRRLTAFAELEGLELDCDPRRQFLVESFAAGTPLECDGIVARGRVQSLGVTEQLLAAEPDFFIDGYLHPARVSRAETERLEATSVTALRALGLDDTGYSIEYRATLAGPRLIEVNGRLGWDEGLPELFRATSGLVPAVGIFRLALGKRVHRARPRRCAAVLYRSNFDHGVVERVPSDRELRALSSRHVACAVHVTAGQRVSPLSDPASRPHLAHVLATDRASIERAEELARASLDGIRVGVRSEEVEKDAERKPRVIEPTQLLG